MARPRKVFAGKTPNERFALRFQSLLTHSDSGKPRAIPITVADVASGLADHRCDASESGIRKWLRGERIPDLETMQALGTILGLADYRMLLPPVERAETMNVPKRVKQNRITPVYVPKREKHK